MNLLAPPEVKPVTNALTPSELSTYAGDWVLDPARSSVKFRTKAVWVMPVKGTFSDVSGEGTVGEDGTVSGRLTVGVASISTGNAKRDQHLLTADFLDAGIHPTLEFVATAARPAGPGRVELDGTLSVHGQSRALTVPATVNADGPSVTVNAEVALDRSQWGVTWTKMGAGLHNQVAVTAVFTRR